MRRRRVLNASTSSPRDVSARCALTRARASRPTHHRLVAGTSVRGGAPLKVLRVHRLTLALSPAACAAWPPGEEWVWP